MTIEICGITPGGHHVALEHVGIARQRIDALLDARAAGVVEADHRRADLHGDVHDLADLGGMHARQRAAEHGEVLAEDIDQPAVDRAVAGHHAVAGDLLVSPCRSRSSGARRTCRTPRTSRDRAARRGARAPSACPWRAARRCGAARRPPARPPGAAPAFPTSSAFDNSGSRRPFSGIEINKSSPCRSRAHASTALAPLRDSFWGSHSAFPPQSSGELSASYEGGRGHESQSCCDS